MYECRGAANVHAEFNPWDHVGKDDIVLLRTSDFEEGQQGEPYWVAKVVNVRRFTFIIFSLRECELLFQL